MNKILESIYKTKLPKLKVDIGVFKHKKTGRLGFCVMGVNTPITKWEHHYVYDASEWDRQETCEVEGTERIQEAFHEDIARHIEEQND